MLSEDTKLKYINKGVKIIQKYGDMSIETIFKSLDIRKFNDIPSCDESAPLVIEYLKSLSEKITQNKQMQAIQLTSRFMLAVQIIRWRNLSDSIMDNLDDQNYFDL